MTREDLYKAYKDKKNKYNVPGYTEHDIEKLYGYENDANKYIMICPICGNNMFYDDYCKECGYSEHDIFSCSEDQIKYYTWEYHKQKEKQPDYVWFVDKVQGYKWK